MQSVRFVAANVSFLTAAHTLTNIKLTPLPFSANKRTSPANASTVHIYSKTTRRYRLPRTHMQNQTKSLTQLLLKNKTRVTQTFLYNTTKHTTDTCKFRVNCACAPKTHICNTHSFSHQLSFLRQMLISSADKRGA